MTAFVILAATLYLAAVAVIWITVTAESIDQHVALADLPAPDATDAEFEAWARQALNIANSAAFEADVRADIAALPTTKETA